VLHTAFYNRLELVRLSHSLPPIHIAAWLAIANCVFHSSSAAQPVRLISHDVHMVVDDRMHTKLVIKRGGKELDLSPASSSETISVSGRKRGDFRFVNSKSRQVRDGFGAGREYALTGDDGELRKQLTVTSHEEYPRTFVIRVRYTNTGKSPIQVDGWTNHHYALAAQPGADPAFWSFQSGSYQRRPSWVLPLKAGFRQENFQGMNSTDYGGGTPVADIWKRDIGIGVGHLDVKPKPVSLPVEMRDGSKAELHIEMKTPRTLAAGESLDTLRTFVAVHTGDYFGVLANYRRMMAAQGLGMPESPKSAFEPIWCAWGYRRDFRPSQIHEALPVVKKLGFQWVTLDDGWQTAEGDWYLEKTKFPNGDGDMRAMVDRIHREGFKAQLWWAPMSVDPGTDLIRDHRDWLLLDSDGSPHKITYWNAFYLCPAIPAVRKNAADLVTKFIRDWGYDGLKLDGQYMNAAPPCYNPAHQHGDPNESSEAVPEFFKSIYDAALAAKREAVVEFCPCGTSYSFFTLPYQNMAVASDPRDSWQVRSKGKTLKALMGDRVAYFGDHVELSDDRQDFASSVGIGAVIGTEFTWPVGSGPAGRDGQRRNDLTPEREAIWSKWVGIYKSKMLSGGQYLGRLYDIGFDVPETHAIRKDGVMYYAFYAKKFSGKVELRGLDKQKFQIRDYVSGRELGILHGPVAALEVNFEKHLLLEAIPKDAGR